MTRNWPYSPGDTIQSAKDNADKEGLATGDNDYDSNSLKLFRSEAFIPFYKNGTGIWSLISGLQGTMTATVLYNSLGDRITISGIGTKTFTANQDNYVFFNETSGAVNYQGVSNGATPPSGNAGDILNAIVVTGASAITTIIQTGKDTTNRVVHNTTPVSVPSNSPRVTVIANSTSVTPTTGNTDVIAITALAGSVTFNVPTGIAANAQGLLFRIKDNGTARSITWNAIYRPIGITMPTATVANKVLYVAARYNSQDDKWDVLSVAREA